MKKINYLLGYNDMHIVQDSEMFKFSLDSVLLPNFVTINKKINKILDIGCGNGPVSLIVSTRTGASITGIEIQKELSDMAKESVEINKLNDQIKIINKDINEYYKNCESDTYDLILSNPPYFKIGETSYKNDSIYKTIARHEVKLNLEQLFIISKKLLKNNGIIAIVHRPDRLVEIIEQMKKNNIEPKRIQFVYPKKGENANILLVEGTKNGNPGLKILDPIYTYDDKGNYTVDVLKCFEKR